MLIEKLYAETVDIEDPNNYGSSPERYLLTFLRRRFEGRCRKGAFITSITGIVEKSQCRIKTTDLSGEGYVDVRFRAQVYILGQWDIITGIRIVSLASQIVGTNYYDPESADDTPLVAVGGIPWRRSCPPPSPRLFVKGRRCLCGSIRSSSAPTSRK